MAKLATLLYITNYKIKEESKEETKNVLMLRKPRREDDPNSGMITPPGGKIENNEINLYNINGLYDGICIKQSGCREVKEETGLIIKPNLNLKFKGTIYFNNYKRIFNDWDWKKHDDYLVHVFSTNSFSGELNEGLDEGIPFWMERREIDTSPYISPGDKKLIDLIETMDHFFARITYHGKIIDENESYVIPY